MSPADIEAELGAQTADDEEVVEVWPEYHDVWDVWLVMANHWRLLSGMGGCSWLGLHLPSLPVALEIAGVATERRSEVMRAVRWMEGQALMVLNEREG